GTHEHWPGDDATHASNAPHNPLQVGAVAPQGGKIVVLVVLVVVVAVADAPSFNAGTQSSLAARATSTAGPKLVLLKASRLARPTQRTVSVRRSVSGSLGAMRQRARRSRTPAVGTKICTSAVPPQLRY